MLHEVPVYISIVYQVTELHHESITELRFNVGVVVHVYHAGVSNIGASGHTLSMLYPLLEFIGCSGFHNPSIDL